MEGRPPQQGGPPPGHQRRPLQGSQSGGPPPGMAHQRSSSQSSQQGRPPNFDVSQRAPSGSPGPSSPKGPRNPTDPGQKNPFGPGLGYDPARDKIEEAKRQEKEIPNRMDLPPEAYITVCVLASVLCFFPSVFHISLTNLHVLSQRMARSHSLLLARATMKRTSRSTFASTSTAWTRPTLSRCTNTP